MKAKAGDFKKMSEKELSQKATELRLQLQDLRLQKFTGSGLNTAMLKKTRKDLARVLTFASAKGHEAKKETKKEEKESKKKEAKK